MLRTFLILASVVSLAVLAGCDASVCVGGSDGIACYTDIAVVAPSITITGAIEAPEASASISKSISKARAPGVTGNVSTSEGEDCGEFTTDSSGAFQLTCLVATLMDADDTDPLNFTTILKVYADNGIQKILEITVTDATTALDAGTADTEDTLAAATYLAELPEGVDLNCWLDSMKAFWRTADVDGDGLSPTSGKLQAVMKDYLAGGYSPLDLGYPTHGDLLKAVIKGEGATAFSEMATKVGKADYQDAYSDAATIASSYGTKLTKEYADSTCTGGASGSLSKAAAGDTSCGDSTADEAAAVAFLEGNGSLVQVVNEAADDDFYKATCALKKDCIAQGSCSGFKEKALAYQWLLQCYGFNFSGFTAEKVSSGAGTWDTGYSVGEWGSAVCQAIKTVGDNLLDADDWKIMGSYYSAQIAATTFNAATEDYTIAAQLVNGSYSADTVGDCMSGKSSSTEWKNCFQMGAVLLGTCSVLCPAGQVCNPNNTCGTCTSDGQCKSYINQVLHSLGVYVCSNGACVVTGSITPPPPSECSTGAQCPLASPSVVGHKLCLNSSCLQCADGAPGNAQCVASFGAGYRCGNGGIGKLACISPTECFTPVDCGAGQICSNSGSCGACTNNASCSVYGAGFVCTGGACVLPPPSLAGTWDRTTASPSSVTGCPSQINADNLTIQGVSPNFSFLALSAFTVNWNGLGQACTAKACDNCTNCGTCTVTGSGGTGTVLAASNCDLPPAGIQNCTISHTKE